ncbi:MAG: type II toxin-antitoxin system HicA family toxin [Chitinispirillaceae bacterium]|nr:type II toxin-antitoxin system HicA family toxin [Chitinispirillaceae bacterium]
MTGKEFIKLLKKNGWECNRISGSHHIMVKGGQRSVPVPVHGKKNLPKGILSALMKQTGVKG